MREQPPCTVALHRFGVWRVAVAVGTFAAIAAIVTWAAQSMPADVEARSGWVVATAVALAVGSAWLGLSLAHVESGVLTGSGSRWAFVADDVPHRPAEPGDLAVAIDLGSFVLLSLRGGSGGARRRWLPVQRRGLERDWHGFRCALYSPPPATLDAHVAGESPL